MTTRESLTIATMTSADYAAVADMWNKSLDGWNGMFTRQTPETTKSLIDTLGGLESASLAWLGNEVVGFCNLESCPWERDTQFIPLMNVRSDLRGHGVGRHLLRHVVERAVKTKDPVLMLFTWPGNTRAVPLYKRLGFFWEPSDSSTLLVNFIPFVLNTPAFAPFFEKCDWLESLKREREVKPDGIKADGSVVYEYLFENDGERLRLQFDKQGYGLRLVETDGYEISLAIEKMELVAGLSYKAHLHILNKSAQGLALALEARDDAHVRTAGSFRMDVPPASESTHEIPFEITSFSEKLPELKNRAGVRVEASVNGVKFPLKVGIDARPAFSFVACTSDDDLSIVAPSVPALEITSALDVPAKVTIPLASSEVVSFSAASVSSEIPARGTVRLALPTSQCKGGLHTHSAQVSATLPEGASLRVEHEITIPVVRWDSLFAGRVNGDWRLNAGTANVFIEDHHTGVAWNGCTTSTGLDFPPLELGEKGSNEFGTIVPLERSTQEGPGWVSYRHRMVSREFPGIEIVESIRLHANGTVERSHRVENHAAHPQSTKVKLRTYLNPAHAVYARAGELVEVSSTPRPGNASSFDLTGLDENWMYFQGSHLGMVWEGPWRFADASHGHCFEWDTGDIPPGGSVNSQRLWVGSFASLEAIRWFALGNAARQRQPLGSTLRLAVNQGNPVLGSEKIPLTFTTHERLECEATLEVSLDGARSSLAAQQTLGLPCPRQAGIHVARMAGELPDRKVDLAQAVLVPGEGDVKVWEEGEVTCCSNGPVELRASASYGPGIHSLRVDGVEWLQSSFPDYAQFGRWNPCFGGLFFAPSSVLMAPLMKEKRSVAASELTDNRGNVWKGIRCKVDFQEMESFRGASFSLHALTLPGVPGLWLVPEIGGGTRTLRDLYCGITQFLPFSSPEKRVQLSFRDSMGHDRVVGHTESVRGYRTQGRLEASLPGVAAKLHAAIQPDVAMLSMNANRDATTLACIHNLTVAPGARVFLPPLLLLLSPEALPAQALEQLLALRVS